MHLLAVEDHRIVLRVVEEGIMLSLDLRAAEEGIVLKTVKEGIVLSLVVVVPESKELKKLCLIL